PLRRLAVAVAALRLPYRPLLPVEAEPPQVVEDRLLAAGHVAGRVGVVDPQQEPVAEAAVRDGGEGVADVQRPGRARRETDAHGRSGRLARHAFGSLSDTRAVSV